MKQVSILRVSALYSLGYAISLLNAFVTCSTTCQIVLQIILICLASTYINTFHPSSCTVVLLYFSSQSPH
ncbi:hypothetical protein V1515DRAFT_597555 [Lipomyces mesembrius]